MNTDMMKFVEASNFTISQFKNNEDRRIIRKFLNSISNINLLKVGTDRGLETIIDILFVDEQDVLMNYILILLTKLDDMDIDTDTLIDIDSYLSKVVTDEVFGGAYVALTRTEENAISTLQKLAWLIICNRKQIIGAVDDN